MIFNMVGGGGDVLMQRITASGTFTSGSVLSVTGLSFEPKLFLMTITSGSNDSKTMLFDKMEDGWRSCVINANTLKYTVSDASSYIITTSSSLTFSASGYGSASCNYMVMG